VTGYKASPHWEQNFVPGGYSFLHLGHLTPFLYRMETAPPDLLSTLFLAFLSMSLNPIISKLTHARHHLNMSERYTLGKA